MLRQASLDDREETSLVNEFGVDGADADKVLGYDNDDDQDRQQQNYGDFQKQVRVTAAKRAEGNRRTGELKMVD